MAFVPKSLIPSAWQMGHQIRAADALYLALTQQLQCPLITLDSRVARAVAIEVLVPGGGLAAGPDRQNPAVPENTAPSSFLISPTNTFGSGIRGRVRQ